MELYNENDFREQKKSKMPLMLKISIAILTLITFLIIYLIIYLNSTVMRIKVDGLNESDIEKILYIPENSTGNELYIPIRKMAKFLGYQDFSGDYQNKSEDTSKCHVKNDYETAMFTLNSKTLIKVRENSNSDIDYIELDKEVFEKNGELYTTIEGIEKAFNVEFEYSAENRKIDIYTMDYLVSYYATNLQLEEKDYSNVFADKKAIFENMIVIKDGGQYGVLQASTGKALLEAKYDRVEYLPNTTDFIVQSNGKVGIVSKDSKTKVRITYDDIRVIDNKNELYMIKQNGAYGVIDSSGEVLIKPEYQQIGLSSNNFYENGVESQYVILDSLIPVRNNNMWGFFNIKGEQVVEPQYTGLGCTSSRVSTSYPVLVIPSYNVVIVEKNKYYNLMRKNGKDILDVYSIDSVYMKTNAATGENTYEMTYNGKTANVEEVLQQLGE